MVNWSKTELCLNYHLGYLPRAEISHFSESLELLHVVSEKENYEQSQHEIIKIHNAFWTPSNSLETWIALSTEFSGTVQGKSKDDDFGFVDMQPGFIDGQGLIFLQEKGYK